MDIEGTVTISINDFDNLKLIEKAMKERKILERVQSFSGYSQSVSHYFMPTESEVIKSALKDLEVVQAENSRLEKRITELVRENRGQRVVEEKTSKKEWWKI